MTVKTAAPVGAVTARPVQKPVTALLVLGLLAVLVVLCVASIMLGSRNIPLPQVLTALLGDSDKQVEAIVWTVRIPRTALGLLAGAGLGLAGALMQALTRNPLADPGLLGVSAGASFAIVISVTTLGVSSLSGFIWFAFIGAIAASAIVYLLGGVGKGGTTPIRLALSGVAVSALLGAITSGMVLADTNALNRYRFWAAGSLAGQDIAAVAQVTPFLVVGMILAISCAPGLNSLALGDQVAIGLGRRVGWLRIRGGIAITLMTAAAVAVCGPIVFVGLVVPHAVRMITGPDHRRLLPVTMLAAPALLLSADLIGRVVARPHEVNVGIVVAVIGGPFFIALVRRKRLAEL